MKFIILAFIFLFILVPPVIASTSLQIPKNLNKLFGEYSGCFLIKEVGSKNVKSFNETQCKKRWTPNSTYKILNSLIGLETGIIKDKNFVIPWDGKKQPFKNWEKDHTLESAIQASAVPYYQELARRIGIQRMQRYVSQVKYGNSDIGKIVDRFWLDGPLKINAYEQLDFIERLYKDSLPFSKRNMSIVKEIIVKSNKDGKVFSGKTGSDYDGKNIIWGWFVGYYKNGQKEYVFVTNIFGKEKAWGRTAMKLSKKIISEMGI